MTASSKKNDFIFQLSKKEWIELITNCDKFSNYRNSPALPFAFTEQGVAMLCSVLRSQKAIQVNIAIMRAFVKLRQIMSSRADLRKKIEEMEKRYDQQFQIVFKAIKSLIQKRNEPRKPVRLFQIRHIKNMNPIHGSDIHFPILKLWEGYRINRQIINSFCFSIIRINRN